MKIHPFLCASAFAACSSAALAQQAAAGSTNPAIPPMNCEKPGDSAGIEPNYAQQQRFQKKVGTYKLCVDDYAKAMSAKADEYVEIAKTYTNAANGAIDSYNTYVTALNAKQKGIDGGSPRQPAAAEPAANPKPKY